MATNRAFLRVLHRTLAVIGVAAAIWTAAIWLLDGFEFQFGGFSLRAHRLDRTMTLAAACLLLTWLLDIRLNGRNVPARWVRWTWRVARAAFLAVLLRIRGGLRVALAYRPPPRVPTLVIGIAIALAAVAASVSVWLAAPPLWLDEETISLNVRDRGFTSLAGPLWLGQSAPLGWLILQHAIVRVFGTAELTLRSVPLAFGLATIGLAVWMGRRWLGVAGTAMLVLLCGFGQWIAHYRFEVKHYTADTFWALLLPALVVWTLEANSPRARMRRALRWWLLAALGLWLANGAALVVPGCALLLVAIVWKRDGLAAAVTIAAVGLIWIAAFGAHYALSMRDTLQSEYLRDFWAAHLPPVSMGLSDRARWVVQRLQELASNPGSTDLWISLWVSAAAGFAFGSKRTLAGAFAVVPITAFLLGAFRVVPVSDRLALWMVPALYVGVALAVDLIVKIGREAYRARRWLVLVAAVGVFAFEVRLGAEMLARGRAELIGGSWNDQKQGVNDREALRWLMPQLRPGDALFTTRLGWPAVWWYGSIRLDDDQSRAAQLPPGVAEYQIAQRGGDCAPEELAAHFSRHPRVLIYLGFRDIPEGFDAVVMRRLGEAGTISSFKRFGDTSWAAVVDLRTPGAGRPFQPPGSRAPRDSRVAELCVAVSPARRW